MAFSSNHTLVSRSARLIGDIHFTGDLQIEGRVTGNIIAEPGQDAKVVVAESGVVEGEIHVPVAVINGQVKGDIYSSKHVELAAKAVVVGSVHYHLIEMVKGSQVNGNLIYRDAGEQGDKLLPLKPTAAVLSIPASKSQD